MTRFHFALALAACVISSPAASFVALQLPTLNFNLLGLTDGQAYNGLFPSQQSFSGVPFALDQSGGQNGYFGNANTSLEIPANVEGATTVYTLMSSFEGTLGAINGRMTFSGSSGASYSVDLVQGQNIRDHYFGAFNNVVNGIDAFQVFGQQGSGHAHLDMQVYRLPVQFQSQTLTAITFTSFNVGGTPFIVAATVSAVPEPVPAALWLVGLLAMGWRLGKASPRLTDGA